jgi:hypothetical protein
MISGLGAVSVACTGGAVVVAGRWATHRVDALGRRRDLPVWSLSVLVLVAVLAAAPGAARRIEERRLARVAATLVGHPVSVKCQTGAAAFVDAGAELGYVPYDELGRPKAFTLIKRAQCHDIERYRRSNHADPTQDEAVAVHVLTHEAMHMRGETDESVAECQALQRDELTAQALGADPQQARHLARLYWKLVYPRMPEDYVDARCVPGGELDEQLTSAPWYAAP